MKRSKPRLNKHEQEIVEAFDRDELVLEDPTPAALASIQRKAAEQGIPYQSLISGLIHQFVEGQLATRADR